MVRSKPEEYLSLACRRPIGMFFGQRLESSKLYKRAAETALRRGLQDVAAASTKPMRVADALSGNCRTVSRLGASGACVGDVRRYGPAEKLARETSKPFSKWNRLEFGATA